MATSRAPRNSKPLIAKVRTLIEDFPLKSQLDVATWLSGTIRASIVPDLCREMKAAAKSEAMASRSAGKTATRGTISTAKRRAAGKKAAATRKARGTQRGGRPARTNSEAHAGIEATSQVPA